MIHLLGKREPWNLDSVLDQHKTEMRLVRQPGLKPLQLQFSPDHSRSFLRLWVSSRMDFKVMLLGYKSLKGLAPD